MFLKIVQKRYWFRKNAYIVLSCIAYIFNRRLMPLIKICLKTALRLNDLYTGFCELSNDIIYFPCVFIDIYMGI